MCYPVKCKKCGKTTWEGCGKHKDMVMAKVPEDQRCKCPRDGEVPEHEEKNIEIKSSIPEIKSEEEFNDLIKKNKVVVIDFYGTFCTICKKIAPIFEKIAEKCNNEKLEVKFAKINGEEIPDVTESQEVAAYPFFIIFKNGEAVVKKPGKITEEGFYEEIKKQL